MIKKLLSITLITVTVICILTACTPSKGETATQISDPDAPLLQEDFSYFNSQLTKAESAKNTATNDAFQSVLVNPETSMAAYYGTEDIIIALPEHSDKTVSIRTSGSFTLDSTVTSVVLIGVGKGFTANAKADSIIIKGDDIKAELNSATGIVYILGKNAEVFVKNNEIEKVIAGNTTALIHNLSDKEISVTLMNGTKVIVSKNQTYHVQDNTLTKYKAEK